MATERAESPRSLHKAKNRGRVHSLQVSTQDRTFIVLSPTITSAVQKLMDTLHLPRSDLAFPLHCPKGVGCHIANSQGSRSHPSFLANGGKNLCYKPSAIPNGEPAEPSSLSNRAGMCDCHWHQKGQKPWLLPCSSCPGAVSATSWHLCWLLGI